MECIIGCGFGGATYLLIALSAVFCFSARPEAIFVVWPFLIILGFVYGFVSGALASLIVLPINASLGRPLKTLWLSFVVGGASGFLPFLLLLLIAAGERGFDWMPAAAFGCFPHMVLGHVFAYLLTRKAVCDHNQRFGVVKHQVSQARIGASRFGITQIMIVTFWCALGFSLLNLTTPEFRSLLAKVFFPLHCAAGLTALLVIKLVSCVRRYRRRGLGTSEH